MILFVFTLCNTNTVVLQLLFQALLFYYIFHSRLVTTPLSDRQADIDTVCSSECLHAHTRIHTTHTQFLSLLAILLTLSTLSHIIPPPPSLPHIFPVLISGVSFIQFVLFYFYFNLLTFGGKTNQPFTTGSKNGGKELGTEKMNNTRTMLTPLEGNCPLPFGIRGTAKYIYCFKREAVQIRDGKQSGFSRVKKTHTD